MPSRRDKSTPMAPQNKEKKGVLTLEKLASYDDVITDALVDKVYFWATIRKNRGGRFTASRGLPPEDIAEILRTAIIVNKDPTLAVKQLLQLPGLSKYVASLREEKDKELFSRHLLKYVRIYMPDCPFEVTTTNRYTISNHEASVTARRDIKPREEIKYLNGVQVAMTEEQEKTLELQQKDFSLIISSRKKTRSLFLGPARFANHDCDANAKLTTKGYEGMQIVATKHIAAGEEITVSYGDDYFGDDNEECLCHTCEDLQRNGWAPYKSKENEDDEDEEDSTSNSPEDAPLEDGLYSFRRKRKYDSNSTDVPGASTSASKKVKINDKDELSKQLQPLLTSPANRRVSKTLRKSTLKKTYSNSSLRQELPISSIEDPSANLASPQISRELRTQQRGGHLSVTIDETASSRESTPQSSTAAGSPKSFLSTDATSVDDDVPTVDIVDKSTIVVKPSLGVATVKTEITRVKTALPSVVDDNSSSSDLSELDSNCELDDVHQEVVMRKLSKTPPAIRTTRSHSRYAEKNRLGTPVDVDPVAAGLVENTRKPGDYVKSDALLSVKYSKWAECHTCDDFFVQEEGFQTRRECPRCERHSKLYGYTWPKTEKEGKHDKEERIKDHREVDRFVPPDEETVIRQKGKRAFKEEAITRLSTPRSDLRESSISTMDPDSGRHRKRLRKTM